ncbi:MAG: SRPBCC family protein [Anaerolineae bacterium]
MINLSASVSIYRPIQQVFEFISATENDFQWQYGTLESARVSTSAVGVGGYFRSIGHLMGRRLLGTFEVTEYETNKRYGFKSVSGPLESRTLYTFQSAKGSTRIDISTQMRPVDAFEVPEKMFERQLKKQLKENLVLLKALLEKRQ